MAGLSSTNQLLCANRESLLSVPQFPLLTTWGGKMKGMPAQILGHCQHLENQVDFIITLKNTVPALVPAYISHLTSLSSPAQAPVHLLTHLDLCNPVSSALFTPLSAFAHFSCPFSGRRFCPLAE